MHTRGFWSSFRSWFKNLGKADAGGYRWGRSAQGKFNFGNLTTGSSQVQHFDCLVFTTNHSLEVTSHTSSTYPNMQKVFVSDTVSCFVYTDYRDVYKRQGNLPPRPLWAPTFEQVGGKKVLKETIVRELRKEIRKYR